MNGLLYCKYTRIIRIYYNAKLERGEPAYAIFIIYASKNIPNSPRFSAAMEELPLAEFSTIEHAVVIASIGATAFIVFTMPRNITAKPRRVIGGHLAGLFRALYVP